MIQYVQNSKRDLLGNLAFDLEIMKYIILIAILFTITAFSLLNFHQSEASSKIVWMQDTPTNATQNFPSLISSPRPIIVEVATSTSSLVGKPIDSITMRLQKVGSPTGLAEVGIFNSDKTHKKVFGTIDVSTISTSLTNYEFKLDNSYYNITSNDLIGFKYESGDASNGVNVVPDRDTTDPQFDTTNSYRERWESGSWIVSNQEDMYMILTQNRPILSATESSPSTIHLSWTAPVNVTTFKIERNSTVIQSGVVGTTYDDLVPSPNTHYNYKVTATVTGSPSVLISDAVDATARSVPSVNEYFTSFFQIMDSSVNNARLYINNIGNVGIGTMPQQKLDVGGNVRLAGNIYDANATGPFKITAPPGVAICIGTGC